MQICPIWTVIHQLTVSEKVERVVGHLFLLAILTSIIQQDDLTIKCDNCDSVLFKNYLIIELIIDIIYRPDDVDLDNFYSDVARVFEQINRKSCYLIDNFSLDLIQQ